MPRLLVLHSKLPSFARAVQVAAARERNVQIVTADLSSVVYDDNCGETGIFVADDTRARSLVRPRDFDVVYFRNVGKHREPSNLIVASLADSDTTVLDPNMRNGRPTARKGTQVFMLKQAGVPVPRTLFAQVDVLRRDARRTLGGDYPLVVKGSLGNRGNTVWMARSDAEMERICRRLRGREQRFGSRYLCQEFIANKGDYRVLVVGDRVLGAIHRRANTPGEFRNNVAIGNATVTPVHHMPTLWRNVALRACRACGVTVGGVDIVLRDNDPNQPLVLEVNVAPKFDAFQRATHIDVPRAIVRYLASRAPLADTFSVTQS